ncbi:MAG: hypothetical protein D3924_07625 [Candidatus Electrothrix sp. AR4]|nr:hypothetical protein [Candidatus Electrothrix sp. AR4]
MYYRDLFYQILNDVMQTAIDCGAELAFGVRPVEVRAMCQTPLSPLDLFGKNVKFPFQVCSLFL